MATAATTPINKPKWTMREIKEPELFQFTKVGQILEGWLISIEPTQVKGKPAVEYLFEGENAARMRCLETADLKKKIHPGLLGRGVRIRYVRDDSSFTKADQNAMKIFEVHASEERLPGY